MPSLDTLLRDPQRLAALQQLMLLDSPTEPAFDRLTKLAAKILRVPVALVSFLDSDREFVKSQVGLPEPIATSRVLPLSASLCKHMIPTREPLIIDDARLHPLGIGNLAVTEMGAVAFAGIPLILDNGAVVGSFCVVDRVPRSWQDDEVDILEELAASVMTEIALHAELEIRRRVEMDMSSAQNRYEALFERSLDAVFIHDFDGQFLDANDAALSLVGYSRAEIPGLNVGTFIAAEQLQRAYALIEEVRAEGFHRHPTEFQIRTRSGKEAYVEVRCSLIYKDGQPLAIQGIAHDVTVRKRVEDMLQEALIREKELSDFKSRLFSLISHEFRNPLASILSADNLLQRYSAHLSEERKRECLDQIEYEVRQLIDLTDELLILGKADSPDVTTTRVAVDLLSFCRAVAADAAKAASTHRIDIFIQGDCGVIDLDTKLMRQALLNLLSNAAKYSPRESLIALSLSCEAEEIEIKVQDSGIGIPPEDMDHLFRQFHRATNVGDIPGTGLGLVIVKRAIDSHGGTIDVDSQVGSGTTFTIRLPRLNRVPSFREDEIAFD